MKEEKEEHGTVEDDDITKGIEKEIANIFLKLVTLYNLHCTITAYYSM
jgi:hypothetical protein